MRAPLLFLAVFAGGCSTPFEPTAEFWEKQFVPKFVQPRPDVLFAGRLDIPLRAGDQILSDCAEFFAEELPEDSTEEERREFESSVACVYPPKGEFNDSMRHYARALANAGFDDESGTYVQSGMNIRCNRTHTLVMAFKGKYVPDSVFDSETLEETKIEGGGDFVHETMMFMIADEACERYSRSAGYSEPPAPEGYAAFPQPNFVDPSPAFLHPGRLDVALRPGDRLVAHCAQYFREEIGSSLPADAIPSEFAQYNADVACIYPPQNEFSEASAWYIDALRERGFKDSPRAQPQPSTPLGRGPAILELGLYQYSGRVALCSNRSGAGIYAMARSGAEVLLDPLTDKFWSTTRGRRNAVMEGVTFPHKTLMIRTTNETCP